MKIFTMPLGAYEANCYIVVNENTKQAVVIDPGAEPDKLKNFLAKNNLSVAAIFITHGHHDHIGALAALHAATKAPIYVHEADASRLGMSADVLLKGGEIIEVAGMKFKTISTPGHTQGGCCFMIQDHVFVGDSIFCETIGRTDLPGGSYKQLISALKTKILTLPETTKLYPGHGPATDVAWERRMNPFLQ